MARSTTAATKADLDALGSELRGEITGLREEIASVKRDVLSFKDEVKLYFDVKVEQLTADFRGIFNDRTVDLTTARKDHERRIRRLEEQMGIYV